MTHSITVYSMYAFDCIPYKLYTKTFNKKWKLSLWKFFHWIEGIQYGQVITEVRWYEEI